MDGGRFGVSKCIRKVTHGTIMVYSCGIVGLKQEAIATEIDSRCQGGVFDMGAFVALSHSG